MERAPRSPDESVFANGLGVNVVYQGLLVSILTLASYFIGYSLLSNGNGVLATTMAFITLSMSEVFHAFNMRSLNKSIFTIRKQNVILWLAGALSFGLTTLLVTVRPLANAFSLQIVSFEQYGISILIALLVIPVVELVKLISGMAKMKK